MAAADISTAWQPVTLANIVGTLNPTPKSYAEERGFGNFKLGDVSGTISAFEGPGKPNVAWCSGLLMSDGQSASRASVTVWCGPLTDVPHLVVSAGVSGGGVDLFIDFKPRADAAYDPSGEYAEPASREAFMQGSNRKDFAEAFYTPEAVEWWTGLCSLDGATHTPLSAAEMARQSAGPLMLNLRLPLTDEAATVAAKACENAVERWLGWMTTADEAGRSLPAGAKQTMTYTRDTKIRAMHYGELLKTYTTSFGPEQGTQLAAADAGPLDEAYVGGGS
eukprot:CAMPEP_0119312430 /NCGR_PEP_ID=MMETSP1333-20130426/26405_1 /TAXON_ID=418940 /ORGANISM="Scyphosphaera apsteinii, Strain RCC1455" /LENGTH=277 /DNA_ID=CAMNT_0007317051 /DNA_START=96 /DNA_END=929 /DNA_ORIENTATION=-